ncbi:MAG TPA: hypothetical protein P5150_08435 [Candidatus Ratteibacteria bacterium]|nr:hypothetical protein [bacterium]HRR96735.1 hypothetical protein [Candidatus Ratteibacteria bacterium]
MKSRIEKDFLFILHDIRERENLMRKKKKISSVEWLRENKKLAEETLGYPIKMLVKSEK